ncbi:MAG: TolC family protein [Armatimonadota bacterium]
MGSVDIHHSQQQTKLLFSLRYTLLLFIILVTFQGSLYAQDIAAEKLALKDAISMSMVTNVTLKRAESSRLDSQSRLKMASYLTSYGVGATTSVDRFQKQSDLTTRVFGNLSYQNLGGTQGDITLSPFAIGNDRGSVGLSLRHPLMQGKGVLSEKSNQVLNAKSSLLIDDKSFYLSTQSTALNVIDSYFKAIEARKLVTEQENAVIYMEQAAIYARKREEAGLGRGIDVSRAEVRVAQTKDQLNLQRASARSAMDRLMLSIGAGVGKDYELTEPVPQSALPVPTLEEAINTAIKNRFELTIFDQQIKDQERAVALTKDKFRNDLDAVASFNSSNPNTGILSGSTLDDGSLRVGVELKIPLDKRIISEDRIISERALDILQKQKLFREEQINQEVRQSYRAYESANMSLQIFTQNLSEAQSNLHIAERMVEEGEGDNRDVLEAQNSLTRVTSSIISARIDLYLASVNLRYAMGEDITKLGQI